MELRHLRYYVAVAENLSFRRAAERLHLTRPALSKQIRELEDELGVRLLERTTARVALTDAGRVYLHEARGVLAQVEAAGEKAHEAASGRRGQLVVGDIGMLGMDLLLPALQRYREAYPHVEVALKELPLPLQVGALEAGEIQVAFALREQVRAHEGLASRPMTLLRVGVALARTHPLAGRTVLGVRDVLDQPLLCIGDGRQSDHARHVRGLLASVGAAHKPIRMIGSLPSLLTLLASGLGVSFLPQDLTAHWPGVKVVPVRGDDSQLEFELHAAWRRHERSGLVKNFVRLLRRPAPVPA